MNIIITMKKIIFIAMLISSVGMCFANQLPHSAESNNGNISFRMPDMTVRLSDEYDEYDDYIGCMILSRLCQHRLQSVP